MIDEIKVLESDVKDESHILIIMKTNTDGAIEYDGLARRSLSRGGRDYTFNTKTEPCHHSISIQ